MSLYHGVKCILHTLWGSWSFAKICFAKRRGELARLINQVETKWRRVVHSRGVGGGWTTFCVRDRDVGLSGKTSTHSMNKNPWMRDEIIFQPSGKSRPHFTPSLTHSSTFKRQSGPEKLVYGLFQVRMENDLLHVTSPELILSARGSTMVHGFYSVTPPRQFTEALLTRFRCNFACSQVQRLTKGLYVVARILFLHLLNCSA